MKKELIYNQDMEDLVDFVTSVGEKKYRAKQIWSGLYVSLWTNIDDFSSLPARLRAFLSDKYSFNPFVPVHIVDSIDGRTQKVLFRLEDGASIEAVLMKYTKRNTLCISTQSGCGMGCTFCATGQMGLTRNLSSGEIIAQVLYFERLLRNIGAKTTNIVLMGMGEPFHNYDQTLEAIDRLNDPDGLNMGARRFTISTVGLIPMINKFTLENRQINLAVSLHTVDDNLRSSMIPINNKYPVDALLDACREYTTATRRRITFEWALIDGVNDSKQDAVKLAAKIKGMLCHVNVIPLNPTNGFDGRSSAKDAVRVFCETLEERGIPCSVRKRRGIEINAGCGQLAKAHSEAENE